jgi:hypothetical protein
MIPTHFLYGSLIVRVGSFPSAHVGKLLYNFPQTNLERSFAPNRMLLGLDFRVLAHEGDGKEAGEWNAVEADVPIASLVLFRLMKMCSSSKSPTVSCEA